MKTLKKIKDIILYLFLSFLLITLILPLFKYRYYAVISDSMYPSIPKYSLVYVKLGNNDLQEKQVIAVDTGGIPLMHRIIEIDGEDIITHGDNNKEGVNEEVKKKDVIGVVKFSLPIIGILFINKYIIPLIILICVMVIIIKAIVKELKKKEGM